MATSSRTICDCGRRVSRLKNGEMVCERCARCEENGIGGGPRNERIGGYNGQRRHIQSRLLNSPTPQLTN